MVVTDKCPCVPIPRNIAVYSHKLTLRQRFISSHTTKDGVYFDIKDWLYMKRHPLFVKEDAVQIQLFYDEFETINPLGSKRCMHKLGVIYFTLINFPKLNASLGNIH